MANIPMSELGRDTAESKGVGGAANWAGAAVSLGLILGAGVWGYQLLVRDVSGVPVVRSVEGPMRIQPDDPGGRQADHQGLAVNDVTAEGFATAPVDRLVLAPSPMSLTQDDKSVSLANIPVVAAEPIDLAKSASSEDIIAPPPLAEGSMSIQALVDQISGDAKPLSGAVTDSVTASVTVTASNSGLTTAESVTKKPVLGGMSTSLRPKLRPERTAESLKLASTNVAVQSPSVEVTEVPAGTRLVQLGAFSSREIAMGQWEKLSVRFADYLGDKTRVVQKATSGGRVFYRLRAMGFDDVSDARRLCSALKAERAECIPVVSR